MQRRLREPYKTQTRPERSHVPSWVDLDARATTTPTGSTSRILKHGNQTGPAHAVKQALTTTFNANKQRQHASDRDPGPKSLVTESPNCTIGRNGTTDPTKNGGFTAPVMVDATLPSSDNTDGDINRGLNPSYLTRTDKPSDTSGLYRFDQEQAADQHGHATHDSREERSMSYTVHLQPSESQHLSCTTTNLQTQLRKRRTAQDGRSTSDQITVGIKRNADGTGLTPAQETDHTGNRSRTTTVILDSRRQRDNKRNATGVNNRFFEHVPDEPNVPAFISCCFQHAPVPSCRPLRYLQKIYVHFFQTKLRFILPSYTEEV